MRLCQGMAEREAEKQSIVIVRTHRSGLLEGISRVVRASGSSMKVGALFANFLYFFSLQIRQ